MSLDRSNCYSLLDLLFMKLHISVHSASADFFCLLTTNFTILINLIIFICNTKTNTNTYNLESMECKSVPVQTVEICEIFKPIAAWIQKLLCKHTNGRWTEGVPHKVHY